MTLSAPKRFSYKPVAFTVAVLAVPVVIFTAFQLVENGYDRSACETNFREIGAAIKKYSDANGGRFPDSFKTMLIQTDISSSAFVCPKTRTMPATGPTTRQTAAEIDDGHCSYVYLGGTMTTRSPASAVVAYEPVENHADGLHVLYADGSVRWLGTTAGRAVIDGLPTEPDRAGATRR